MTSTLLEASSRRRAMGEPSRACGAVALDAALPVGRRARSGQALYYAARVPEGQERALAVALPRLVDRRALTDIRLPRRECWVKHAGAWSLKVEPMHPGYLFLASPDARQLNQALTRLTTARVELTGALGRGWVPLDGAYIRWLDATLDATGTLRSSTAAIIDGKLRVLDGPLTGQEARVARIDRHRRVAWVSACGDGLDFTEAVALHVPFKGTAEEFEASRFASYSKEPAMT